MTRFERLMEERLEGKEWIVNYNPGSLSGLSYDDFWRLRKKKEDCGYLDEGRWLVDATTARAYGTRDAAAIIWMLCVGDIPEDMRVSHIDGNRKNNHLENLELIKRRKEVERVFKDGLAGAIHIREKISLREEELVEITVKAEDIIKVKIFDVFYTKEAKKWGREQIWEAFEKYGVFDTSRHVFN